MLLRDKEIEMLKVLEKLTICTDNQLAILSNLKCLSSAQKRRIELERKGLIYSEYRDTRKISTLTQQGLTEIEKRRAPYVPKGFMTDHIICTSYGAAFAKINNNVAIESILDEKEIKKLELHAYDGKRHNPDLVIGREEEAICFEIEISVKSKEALESNVRKNSENFGSQIWIVPRRLKGLKSNLNRINEKYDANVEIFDLEDIVNSVNNYDLANNTPGNNYEIKLKTKKNTILEVLK